MNPRPALLAVVLCRSKQQGPLLDSAGQAGLPKQRRAKVQKVDSNQRVQMAPDACASVRVVGVVRGYSYIGSGRRPGCANLRNLRIAKS